MQPVAFLQARLATRAPVAAASFVSLIIHAAPASAAEEHVARIPTAAAVSAVTAPAQTTHVVAQIPRSVMTTPLSQLTTALKIHSGNFAGHVEAFFKGINDDRRSVIAAVIGSIIAGGASALPVLHSSKRAALPRKLEYAVSLSWICKRKSIRSRMQPLVRPTARFWIPGACDRQ